MRPTAHLHFSLIIVFLLEMYSTNFLNIYAVFLVCGSVFIDGDILLKIFFKERNHRRYVTHSILFWFILGVIFYLSKVYYLYFFTIGVMFHLLLDLVDWGLPLIPHLPNQKLTPHLLKRDDDENRKKAYINIYWKNKIILLIEIILLISGVTAFIFLNWRLQLLLLIAIIPSYGYLLLEILNMKKNI